MKIRETSTREATDNVLFVERAAFGRDDEAELVGRCLDGASPPSRRDRCCFWKGRLRGCAE